MTNAGGDDRISDETRMRAARVRDRAVSLPTAADIGDLAVAALLAKRGRDMTPDEIRQVARAALTKAQQMSYLLGLLAGVMDDPGSEP